MLGTGHNTTAIVVSSISCHSRRIVDEWNVDVVLDCCSSDIIHTYAGVVLSSELQIRGTELAWRSLPYKYSASFDNELRQVRSKDVPAGLDEGHPFNQLRAPLERGPMLSPSHPHKAMRHALKCAYGIDNPMRKQTCRFRSSSESEPLRRN